MITYRFTFYSVYLGDKLQGFFSKLLLFLGKESYNFISFFGLELFREDFSLLNFNLTFYTIYLVISVLSIHIF